MGIVDFFSCAIPRRIIVRGFFVGFLLLVLGLADLLN